MASPESFPKPVTVEEEVEKSKTAVRPDGTLSTNEGEDLADKYTKEHVGSDEWREQE
ncbi:MAG: hypothetical protein V1656_03330 [Candidatus Jorgensenbacteria bacterium]